MATCVATPGGRRKLFWATQPDACGADQDCSVNCGRPGLSYVENGENNTISTSNWLRGLIINMIMTDGKRPDDACGYTPGSQGGHWSESYGGNREVVGTLLRTIEPMGSVNELIAMVNAHAQSTLQRLVSRGVALRVETTVSYLGAGRFQLNVVIYGTNNEVTKVGLTAGRMANSWIWSADE